MQQRRAAPRVVEGQRRRRASAPRADREHGRHLRRAQLDLAAAEAQSQRRAQVGGGLGRGRLGGGGLDRRLRAMRGTGPLKRRHSASAAMSWASRRRRVDGETGGRRPHADRVADQRQRGVARRRLGGRRDLLQAGLEGGAGRTARPARPRRRRRTQSRRPSTSRRPRATARRAVAATSTRQTEIGQRERERPLSWSAARHSKLRARELAGEAARPERGVAGETHAAGRHAEGHAPVR